MRKSSPHLEVFPVVTRQGAELVEWLAVVVSVMSIARVLSSGCQMLDFICIYQIKLQILLIVDDLLHLGPSSDQQQT